MPSHALGTEVYDVTNATTGGVFEYLRRILFFYSILIVFLPLGLGLIVLRLDCSSRVAA
jgi:hypothetical protein